MTRLASPPDVLARILATKAEEVASARSKHPLDEVVAAAGAQSAPRGFVRALAARIAAGNAAVIAEVKKASPSKGLLRPDFDPAAIARSYEAGGATCLSVLTDAQYFQGSTEALVAARGACALPVLRKDFMIDVYQVAEARAMGADCILLIVAALADARMRALADYALEFGLDLLVEAHDGAELDRALALGLDPSRAAIGVNNRDLRNFDTRLETTLALVDRMPKGLSLITESGIATRADVATMRAAGVHGFLIGETFMRAPDPGRALAEMFGR
jgi:indole-3-glycerol phosphate synthase